MPLEDSFLPTVPILPTTIFGVELGDRAFWWWMTIEHRKLFDSVCWETICDSFCLSSSFSFCSEARRVAVSSIFLKSPRGISCSRSSFARSFSTA